MKGRDVYSAVYSDCTGDELYSTVLYSSGAGVTC